MDVAEVYLCYLKQLSYACSDSEQPMTFSNYSSLIFLKQNITNKYVDDAYYSETSPSDTGLMIPSVQSRETLECL